MRRVLVLAVVMMGLLAAYVAHADVPPRNPDAVAVIIGNKTYVDRDVPEVAYADRDAAAIERYVIDVLGYDERNIIMVANATQGKLISLFGSAENPHGQLADWVREGRSDVFVYYSGHGVPGGNGEAYLLPVDADPATIELNGYKLSQLKNNLLSIEARSFTVVLDACFSGASGDGGNLMHDASVLVRPASPVPAGVGAITWVAASGAEQAANWDKADRHGLFTEYFLRAVYGAADDPRYGGHGDGKITLGAVHKYLDEEMSYIARREYRRPQKASVSGDLGTVLALFEANRPPSRADTLTPATTVSAIGVPPAVAHTPASPTVPQETQVTVAEPPTLPTRTDFSAYDALASGYAAHQAGKIMETIDWYQRAAEMGNATAMFELGWLYLQDPGVKKNCTVALSWLQKAAALGNENAKGWLRPNAECPWGSNALATEVASANAPKRIQVSPPESTVLPASTSYSAREALASGYSAHQAGNIEETIKWYRRAADMGDATAMFELGWLYLQDPGVKKDCGLARSWLQK
jgi:TPR repeat protein